MKKTAIEMIEEIDPSCVKDMELLMETYSKQQNAELIKKLNIVQSVFGISINDIDFIVKKREEELLETLNMHPKVLNFAKEMQKQLGINTELGKTTWETWGNIKEILVDFEYHKAKAIMALKEDNIGALREYLADCGNILMFLGNACDLYGAFEDTKPVFQMVSPLFIKTTIKDTIIKNNIDKL